MHMAPDQRKIRMFLARVARRKLVFGVIAVGAVAIFAVWTAENNGHAHAKPLAPGNSVRATSATGLTNQAIARAAPAIWLADAAGRKDVNKSLQILRNFFQTAKANGAPKFAGDVLGWGNEWRTAVDEIPFTSHKHAAWYTAHCFRKDILTAAQLRQTIKAVVADYQSRVQAVNNRLVEHINDSLQDIPLARAAHLPPLVITDQQFKHATAAMLAQTHGTVVKRIVGTNAASLVVLTVSSKLAPTLLAQTGLLGAEGTTDAAAGLTGPETFGLSIVAGLAVNKIVDVIYDKIEHPHRKITQATCILLDQMQADILNGTAKQPGLIAILNKDAHSDALLRRAAVKRLINQWGTKHAN